MVSLNGFILCCLFAATPVVFVKGVERSGITIIEQVATYVSPLACVHRK